MSLGRILNFKNLNLRIRNVLVFVSLFSYLSSQAEPVIRAATTPFPEYAAWIATHPDDRSWVRQIESQHPSKTEISVLAELVEASQKAYLTGSLEDAKNKFREISDLADTSDWRTSEREAITYAMLRFYQLDKSELGLKYLKLAAIFGFDCHFDPHIFPPPVIQAWKDELTKAHKHAVRISNLRDFGGFDVMKVDGRNYSLADTEFISILPVQHRISLLGSQAQYFTQKIGSSQLQVMKVEPVVLISGTCADPQVNPEIHFAFTALFNEACIRNFTGQSWVAASSTKRNSQFSKLELQSRNFRTPDDQLQSETYSASSTHTTLRTWIWVSVGAVVATSLALIYANNQSILSGSSNSPTAVTPVHRSGN